MLPFMVSMTMRLIPSNSRDLRCVLTEMLTLHMSAITGLALPAHAAAAPDDEDRE